jgi:hypothetical protein
MKNLRVTLATGVLATAMCSLSLAHSQDVSKPAQPAVPNMPGLHDFDFEFGEWHVHHGVKRPTDSQQWLEFEGTCSARSLMDGMANVEDHLFNKPTGVTRGVGLRAYDPKSARWAISFRLNVASTCASALCVRTGRITLNQALVGSDARASRAICRRSFLDPLLSGIRAVPFSHCDQCSHSFPLR